MMSLFQAILLVSICTYVRGEKTPKVCYADVGCFTNEPPFVNSNGKLPQSPEYIGTRFVLYTRANPTDGVYVDYTDMQTLANSHFDHRNPVKIAIHGFAMSLASSDWYQPLKDSLLKTEPMNVVFVGWGNGAKAPYYKQAVSNTRLVAKEISLLMKLMIHRGSSLAQMHLIGHSLGAQISGYVGQEFKGQLGRISGLDPAGPAYQDQSVEVRLDSTDAIFVDVIHSNGAPIYRGGAGSSIPCGDVDFYLNGGMVQPGCKPLLTGTFEDVIEGKTGDAFHVVSCSHSRSHEIYVETVNPECPFTAYPCNTLDDFVNGKCFTCGSRGCNQMGYHANNKTAMGGMMLLSKSASPFCGYHYKISTTPLLRAGEIKSDFEFVIHGTGGVTETLSIDDLKLKTGSASRVVVASANTVDVLAIDVTNKRKKEFELFGWRERGTSLGSMKIDVTVGQTGKTYAFCLPKSGLNIGQTLTLEEVQSETC